MTRSNTNYRRALVAPTAGDSIREAHCYEYDNNGNILYVNTSRVKPDMTTQPDTVQRGREERFRWDEENRLTAASDLRTVRYRDNIGMINGKFKSWKSVLRNSVLNGTDFYRIDGCIIRNEDGSKNNN